MMIMAESTWMTMLKSINSTQQKMTRNIPAFTLLIRIFHPHCNPSMDDYGRTNRIRATMWSKSRNAIAVLWQSPNRCSPMDQIMDDIILYVVYHLVLHHLYVERPTIPDRTIVTERHHSNVPPPRDYEIPTSRIHPNRCPRPVQKHHVNSFNGIQRVF